MPSCLRYGIFSINPAYVPRFFSDTPELGWRVKPRTCISYRIVREDGRRKGVSRSQSYARGSSTALFNAVAVLSLPREAASRLYFAGTTTARPYGSRRTLVGAQRRPLGGAHGAYI